MTLLDAIKQAEQRACRLEDDLREIRGLNEGPNQTPAQKALYLHLLVLMGHANDVRDGLRRLWP